MQMGIKSKLAKAVLAAAALGAAGGANAAISYDAGNSGDGELFINIYRNTTSPATLVLDTNLSANALVSGAITSWNSNAAQQSAVSAFLGTATPGEFLFDAGAIQNSFTDVNQYGLLLTNTDDTLLHPANPTVLGEFITAATIWAKDVNQNANNSPDGLLNPAAAGDYGDWAADTKGWNGDGLTLTWNETTDTAAGNDLALYRFFFEAGTFAPVKEILGHVSIDTATGLVAYNGVSPVPLPPAVWLLGSALVGLVSVARRRRGDGPGAVAA